MAIAPTAPPIVNNLPPAPNSGTDTPSEFDVKANNFVAGQVAMVGEENALSAWQNTTATQVYDNAVEAKSSADEAAFSATASASASNYKGLWSSLTGALNKPATVFHNDLFWYLNTDLADVTASEPTISNANWQLGEGQVIILDGGVFNLFSASTVPEKYQVSFVRKKGVTDASVKLTGENFKTDKGDFDEIIIGDSYGFTATCISGIWEV